jgi:DNA-binding transcriptional regulator YdaS (Cro superfamily)
VPADRCLPIERATGGAVTRYDLRPDIFGDAPDGAPAREAG